MNVRFTADYPSALDGDCGGRCGNGDMCLRSSDCFPDVLVVDHDSDSRARPS
jgi:hypothetical protein